MGLSYILSMGGRKSELQRTTSGGIYCRGITIWVRRQGDLTPTYQQRCSKHKCCLLSCNLDQFLTIFVFWASPSWSLGNRSHFWKLSIIDSMSSCHSTGNKAWSWYSKSMHIGRIQRTSAIKRPVHLEGKGETWNPQ